MKTHINKYKMWFLILVCAFAAGRYSGPKSVETKEVEKIVYKDRIVKDEKTKTHSERRETILPDGTKIREIIRDRGTESKTDTNREYSQEKSKETKTVSRPDWSIGVYSNREFFAGTLDRRILGALWVGIHARSEVPLQRPEVGVGIRLEF